MKIKKLNVTLEIDKGDWKEYKNRGFEEVKPKEEPKKKTAPKKSEPAN